MPWLERRLRILSTDDLYARNRGPERPME